MPIFQRRRARRLSYLNGGLWATGNGLASSGLLIYMAIDLGTPRVGLGLAMIRAAPQLAGLLRLGAPALIGRLADRKRFCLLGYLASALVLCSLPWLARPGLLPTAGQSLSALVLLWCLYHLLQFLADVALWSWLADLAPVRVRGRFLGRRERWMLCGTIAGMLASGLFSYAWKSLHPFGTSLAWLCYAIPAALGAALMLAAMVPLARIPSLTPHAMRQPVGWLTTLCSPLGDRRFLRLLIFGCWFSFFNGAFQAPQDYYPVHVLGISFLLSQCLVALMRCGQWSVSPWAGRQVDRRGNRPVMMLSLALVAAGPLFYFLSTPQQPWWFVGASVMWIAYAGLNVGLPNLMLKLSPREANASYIATYYAVTGLCMAASTLVGASFSTIFAISFSTCPCWGRSIVSTWPFFRPGSCAAWGWPCC